MMWTLSLGWNVLLLMFVIMLHTAGRFETRPSVDEIAILLSFKTKMIHDPQGCLSNWSPSDLSPCNSWSGIICHSSGNKVIGISLPNRELGGEITALAAICQLPELTILQLNNNSLTGSIATDLVKSCERLESLDLSNNYVNGSIPEEIFKLHSLTYLNLSLTSVSGVIPSAIGLLANLQSLDLSKSLFTGNIPPELGNLSKLSTLDLGYNPFSAGKLPSTLGNLRRLQTLSLPGCQLTGGISPRLGNSQQIAYLDLSRNSLSGSIPVELMNLRKLRKLEVFDNQLSGRIPNEIVNLRSLTDLDLSANALSGFIPAAIGSLEALELLHLQNNSLRGEIPKSLAELSRLKEIRLFLNELTGSLPSQLGARSALRILDVSSNYLSGELPSTLCSGGQLRDLILFDNQFSGYLPNSYGICPSLVRVRVFDNQLMGSIPVGLWSSPELWLLDVHKNKLSGIVSPEVRRASKLAYLDISNNEFSGGLPADLDQLSHLSFVSASQNNLSGGITIFKSCPPALLSLAMSGNTLTGKIPDWIGTCSHLCSLDLSDNRLTGPLPSALGSLLSLNYLDVSSNILSGDIPSSLAQLKLISFNVSFNSLSGEIPPAFVPIFGTSFEGNPGLCGFGHTPCPSNGVTDKLNMSSHAGVTRIVAVLALFAFVSGFLSLLYLICRRRRNRCSRKSKWTIISFQKLDFKAKEVIGRLNESNVVGIGGSGKVYCASFGNGKYVAVKKLWKFEKDVDSNDHLDCPKEFDNGFKAEVEILGTIRHRNIVKLLCCCWTPETNLLVYEFMVNGSLGDQLHRSKPSNLNWATRYKIALGAAQGLAYLHHDCVPQIIHRDVKSNNILLDLEFEAHLADFGLAKFRSVNFTGKAEPLSMVAGSYGYIAPEYAYTFNVSEKSDVFSYGVVLLELVTGRMPVEPEYGESEDIVKWVRRRCHSKEGALSVLDPSLFLVSEMELESILSLMKLALLCTHSLPSSRPSMRDVITCLLDLHHLNVTSILDHRFTFSTQHNI